LIDLGCGDGAFIFAVKKDFPNINITGVDISPRRIEDLKNKLKNEKFYCEDICTLKINKKFDLVYSSQVIEHVPSDKKMIEKISSLLKKRGILIISSVIKKPYAIYKYRNNSRFVLDPTHEREYRNREEFLRLFEKKLDHIQTKIDPVKRKFLNFEIKIPGYFIIESIFTKKEQ